MTTVLRVLNALFEDLTNLGLRWLGLLLIWAASCVFMGAALRLGWWLGELGWRTAGAILQ
jgi:hypothetical protein